MTDECQRCHGKTAHVWVNRKKLLFLGKTPEQLEKMVADVRIITGATSRFSKEEIELVAAIISRQWTKGKLRPVVRRM